LLCIDPLPYKSTYNQTLESDVREFEFVDVPIRELDCVDPFLVYFYGVVVKIRLRDNFVLAVEFVVLTHDVKIVDGWLVGNLF
jgi:hypothetical protein